MNVPHIWKCVRFPLRKIWRGRFRYLKCYLYLKLSEKCNFILFLSLTAKGSLSSSSPTHMNHPSWYRRRRFCYSVRGESVIRVSCHHSDCNLMMIHSDSGQDSGNVLPVLPVGELRTPNLFFSCSRRVPGITGRKSVACMRSPQGIDPLDVDCEEMNRGGGSRSSCRLVNINLFQKWQSRKRVDWSVGNPLWPKLTFYSAVSSLSLSFDFGLIAHQFSIAY